MDSDPRTLSDMFATPVIQNPLQNSHLMDSDTTTNGRPSKDSRPKTNGRSRSATNPESSTPQPPATFLSSSPTITRIASTPTATTTPAPRAQPKARRGLFSLLASAAQPPSTFPKSETSTKSNDKADTPTPTTPIVQPPPPPPSFMQSLARRISGSSGKKQTIDIKTPVPQCPRRTLNVNYARPRPEIKELEKIQLRRVSFVADETLISKRVFKASEPFETELPREPKLKVKDLREAYYRSSRNREVTPDDRVAKAFAVAEGIEMQKLDLSNIKFGTRDSVLPICDVLSLAKGLEEVLLDYCELTDEQLRLFAAALLCLKPRSESETENRGVAKLSLAGNTTLGLDGWKILAGFVHMNADLVALNISHIPLSTEAAPIFARAIALPNPSRREIPPEFRLQPILPKPRQRKFSFRRVSSGSLGADLVRVISPSSRRQSSVSDEIELIEEKPELEQTEARSNTDLPEIPLHTPLTPTFVNAVPSAETSSIVIVESPNEIPPRPPPPRRKVEELRMNHCEMSAEILELFLSAVTQGGVRYWDIGANKFGKDGMKIIAGLFDEVKSEAEESKLEESGRSSPTPLSSMLSAPVSTTTEDRSVPTLGKLEYLSLEGTDLSCKRFDPMFDVWLNHPNPNNLSLWALDLTNCRLGQDLTFFMNLFQALQRFPNLRLLYLSQNPLFSNPGMIKTLRDWLPRLPLLRRLNLSSTGMQAQHLVELAQILPEVKPLVALDITKNPIYEMNDVEEEREEGRTEDVSGLTALEVAMRYCPQIIEVELPEGGGVEATRLRHRIFLRCFKNIEFLDCAAHPTVADDPSERGLGGRKRPTAEEAKELAQQPTREGRDKFKVERGHGVARALETVLLNAQRDDKAQDMSLDLLYRARKIKERLQPALGKGNQDEATLRRLNFLNQVLTKVIDRFEEAFPECANAPPKPKPAHDPDSSDEEPENEEQDEDNITSSPPSPTLLRRASSMTELARGLELEEGDVHRFGSIIKKRNLIASVETDLTGEQLLEAILKVDKETVEREVWDKDDLRKVLRKSIDDGSTKPAHGTQSDTAVTVVENITVENITVENSTPSTKEKRDSDSHSI